MWCNRLNDVQTAGDAAALELRIDAKRYVSADGASVEVVRGLELRLEAGSFGVLIGPSGCGKTTILRIAAGLDPDFRGQLHKESGHGGRALEFTILCSVRTGDVLGPSPMLWSHVDLERRLWTIPKTKNGTEHRVPLSDAAMAVLEAMRPLRDSSNVVFSGHDKIMLRTLDRVGRSNLTTHGFRATFKTWASECTSYDRDVVEACLTHTISDRLERAYRSVDFLEKVARLMTAWGSICDGCTVPQA